MSELGKSEAMRWDAIVRASIPWIPPAVVTDDLESGGTTIGGFPKTIQYQHQLPRAVYKITPEFVPGQAIWWHEREHDMFARVQARVGSQHGKELVKAAFTARGADPALVDANESLATEQMASMLPEAFIGEWGGYPHPCQGVPVPPGMRAFFLGMETWVPETQPILPSIQKAIEWLGPLPTSNFFRGRVGHQISLIVDHWTATTFEGALAHFRNGAARVSAHYLISQKGRIVQVVADEDTAYHCGNWTLNQQSIGIEHEGGPNLPAMTPELYAASAWLHNKLSLDYGIRLVVGETVRRHGSIVPTQCPGTLDLDRIVREAGGIEDMTDADFLAMYERLIKPGVDNTIKAVKDRLEIDAHHSHVTGEPVEK